MFLFYIAGMHPPPFSPHHRLSDWPDCLLDLQCQNIDCRGRSSHYPVRLLRTRYGDPSFAALLRRLRCKHCRKPPTPVYLVAGHHRTRYGGPPADWSIELIEPPRPFRPVS